LEEKLRKEKEEQERKEREEREEKVRVRREREAQEKKEREEREKKEKEKREKKAKKEREKELKKIKRKKKVKKEDKERIICYFCGSKAYQKDSPETTDSKIIECPSCTLYEVTEGAIAFFLKREDGQEFLCEEQKEKLSEYIQENFNPKHPSPVSLTIKEIEQIADKTSYM